MLQYYISLLNDIEDYDTRTKVAYAKMMSSLKSFDPFEKYLRNTIKTQERKQDIKATWTKVVEENLADLMIIGGLYEIKKNTRVRVLNNSLGTYNIINRVDDPDFEEELKFKVGKEKYLEQITKEDYFAGKIELPINVRGAIRANWGFDDLELEPAWELFEVNSSIKVLEKEHRILSVEGNYLVLEGNIKETTITYNSSEFEINVEDVEIEVNDFDIISEDERRVIVYSKTDQKNKLGKKLKFSQMVAFLNFEDLREENGTAFSGERRDHNVIKIDEEHFYNSTVCVGNVKFRLKKIGGRSAESYWIQLKELDAKEDDIPGYSPLKYFFDDDISIKDDRGTEYLVSRGDENENKIILRKKNEPRLKYCFPEGLNLSVKVNTYQLRKQLEAVRSLKNMPVGEHALLLRLFEDIKYVRWDHKTIKKLELGDWIVLKDAQRSGCLKQREFVEKALSSPDFSILEGPPGSGKTTVILELICQLVKRNKRILLCGSTHVAIDNVLERLQEEELLEKLTIYPIRIGDEKRINEDVKAFQIDNAIGDNGWAGDLILDASNLVCGTTIGILQHPKFKKRTRSTEPIVPEFDYLIIDECSKTTFQEFLVPALYAKKWVLVGDVMQLSPFTDRNEIVSNIEKIVVQGKQFPTDCQQAIFILQKVLKSLERENKFILLLDNSTLKFAKQELSKGRIEDFEQKGKLVKIVEQSEDINPIRLVGFDLIVVEHRLFKEHSILFPETHAVLLGKKMWETSKHSFVHNYYYQKGRNRSQNLEDSFYLKEKGRTFTNSFDIVNKINDYLYDKSWAEEIAWRIDREHQLRLIEDNRSVKNYQKVVQDLLPKSFSKREVEEQIHLIASMAFPSILESLINGIKGKKLRMESTISNGFNGNVLKNRWTKLTYQHRMHPGISEFPRSQFYQNEALKDLESPYNMEVLRAWDYNRYHFRNVWVDVEGETKRNCNVDEVNVLIRELKSFIEYATNNPREDNKPWTIACLTFYRGQEAKIREALKKYTKLDNGFSNFYKKDIKENRINIKLHTVDKFQGHEADIVFLSMVQTYRDGFMDNPNRLNVAITRAKYQLVVIGNWQYFSKKSNSGDLKKLATSTHKFK
jgi:hypothetical protein